MGSINLSQTGPEILDIRHGEMKDSLAEDLKTKLRPANGEEKQLSTLLLYDEMGLRLFEEITYLPEYYLTNTEIALLERFASQLADHIPDGALLLELGSGYDAISSLKHRQ